MNHKIEETKKDLYKQLIYLNQLKVTYQKKEVSILEQDCFATTTIKDRENKKIACLNDYIVELQTEKKKYKRRQKEMIGMKIILFLILLGSLAIGTIFPPALLFTFSLLLGNLIFDAVALHEYKFLSGRNQILQTAIDRVEDKKKEIENSKSNNIIDMDFSYLNTKQEKNQKINQIKEKVDKISKVEQMIKEFLQMIETKETLTPQLKKQLVLIHTTLDTFHDDNKKDDF